MKPKIAHIIYISLWSIVLLAATFPKILTWDLFPLTTELPNLFKDYTYPLMFVMALFLLDVAYGFYLENVNRGTQKGIIVVLSCVILFFLCYGLSLGSFCSPCTQNILFAVLWVALTVAKAAKTEKAEARVAKVKHKISDK